MMNMATFVFTVLWFDVTSKMFLLVWQPKQPFWGDNRDGNFGVARWPFGVAAKMLLLVWQFNIQDHVGIKSTIHCHHQQQPSQNKTKNNLNFYAILIITIYGCVYGLKVYIYKAE